MPLFRFPNRLVLFVHIPKTGGTSIEALLASLGGIQALRVGERLPGLPCTPQHLHAELLERLLPTGFYDFAFCVVRNPYDRLASEYRMRTANRGQIDFNDWVGRALTRYRSNPFANDNHLRPQSEFLIKGTHLLRFERDLDKQLRDLLESHGIMMEATVPWLRRGERVKLTVRENMLNLIREVYRADFDSLGYSEKDFGEIAVEN